MVPSMLRVAADEVEAALRDVESQQQATAPPTPVPTPASASAPAPAPSSQSAFSSSPLTADRRITLAEALASDSMAAPKRLRRSTPAVPPPPPLPPSPSPSPPRPRPPTSCIPPGSPTAQTYASTTIRPSSLGPMTLAEALMRNQLTPPRRLRKSQLSPYEADNASIRARAGSTNESVATATASAGVTDSPWIPDHGDRMPQTPQTPSTSVVPSMSTCSSTTVSSTPNVATDGHDDDYRAGGWDMVGQGGCQQAGLRSQRDNRPCQNSDKFDRQESGMTRDDSSFDELKNVQAGDAVDGLEELDARNGFEGREGHEELEGLGGRDGSDAGSDQDRTDLVRWDGEQL